MKEFDCPIGKLKTFLPEEVWVDKSGLKEVIIPPCSGCSHRNHVSFLNSFDQQSRFSDNLGLKTTEIGTEKHYVSIGKNAEGIEIVQCVCGCDKRLKFPSVIYDREIKNGLF